MNNYVGNTLLDFTDNIIESAAIQPHKLTTEIKKLELNLNDYVSLISLNIRGIKTNFNLLLLLLKSIKVPVSILALCETWLNDGEELLFNIPGYTRYTINRKTRGGGLIIYILDNFTSHIASDISLVNDNIESLFIKVQIKNKVYYFGNIYRNPTSRISNFINDLDNIILKDMPLNNVTLCGDFNINLLGLPSPICLEFFGLMSSKNLNLCISKPTRIATTNRTTSDGIMTRTTLLKKIHNNNTQISIENNDVGIS